MAITKLTRRTFLASSAIGAAQQRSDFRVDVDLVTLTFTAMQRNGQPVDDLRIEELRLLDDGQPRPIVNLWRDLDIPLTIGLIADVSITQAGYIASHRNTIHSFLNQVLHSGDRVFVVTTAADVVLVADLTDSLPVVMEAIDKIESTQSYGKRLGPECPPKVLSEKNGITRQLSGCGGSELWDAIFHSARLKLKPASGRKALIFISDGLDTGSVHSLSDAIEAVQGADALVYTIFYRERNSGGAPINLERLARDTGGRSFEAFGANFPKIFARIEEDLRSIWVLAFRPPVGADNGAFRKVKLTTTRKGITLRARPGYSAPAFQRPK